MLFLLYLALPQIQGSSYLYKTHLQPFFRTHETQIDSTLARVKSKLFAFLQQRARMIWAQAATAIGQPPSTTTESSITQELEEDERLGSVQRPSLGNPISGPAALVSNLWRSYGPGILAGGMALVSSAAVTANAAAATNADATRKRPGASVLTTPPGSRVVRSGGGGNGGGRHSRQSSSEERKKRQHHEQPTPERRGSSESVVKRRGEHVRNRSGSGGSGKFEEVEVPSDVEDEIDAGGHAVGGGGGGWLSGWGSGSGGKGYERVKND